MYKTIVKPQGMDDLMSASMINSPRLLNDISYHIISYQLLNQGVPEIYLILFGPDLLVEISLHLKRQAQPYLPLPYAMPVILHPTTCTLHTMYISPMTSSSRPSHSLCPSRAP